MTTNTLDILKAANRFNTVLHFNILKDRCDVLNMNIQLLKLNDGYKDEKACKDLIDAYIDLRMSHSRFVTTTYEAHELHDLSDDYDNKKFASDLIVELKRKVLETGNKLLIKLAGYVDRNDISKLEDYLF